MNITKDQIEEWVCKSIYPMATEDGELSEIIKSCFNDLAPKWVSVDDELPITKADGLYRTRNVIATDGSDVCEMMFTAGCTPKPWFEWSKYGDIAPEDITHWMPLPEPPK